MRAKHQRQERAERFQGMNVLLTEVRVVNDKGEEVPWDGTSVGELQSTTTCFSATLILCSYLCPFLRISDVCEVRGPFVCRSYYRNNDTSSFTLDGWFRYLLLSPSVPPRFISFACTFPSVACTFSSAGVCAVVIDLFSLQDRRCRGYRHPRISATGRQDQGRDQERRRVDQLAGSRGRYHEASPGQK